MTVDEMDLEEPPQAATPAGRDGGARYGQRAAARVGPLRPDGFPAVGVGLSCDPGTGAGQCPRLMVQGRQKALAQAPFGWDAGAGARASDAAWWRAFGERHGGELDAELDIDAALPGRGAWTPGED